MCGITGAFSVDGSSGPPLERHVLERMTESIRHRGPDDAGLVLDDAVALGARRLSIVDVAGGHQPMPNETGRIWGAQNGEIYNHDDLRRGLGADGHSFRTRCDTEVLPHLWEEHGPALCERLRGKYGIAVWDGNNRVGLLARDRLGIKPLYYAETNGLVVFGSELKAVIASGLIEEELDLDAIASYLTLGFIPAPLTPLAGVRKLRPGERLITGEGTVRLEQYWSYPSPPADPMPIGVEEAGERLLEALDESVRMRLMSDVPLGAMLSGGLDSSVIVALMARHMDEPVKTFSVGFRGDSEGNELGDARRVAQIFGTDHRELELPLGSSADDLSRLVWHMDEPLADLSALGFTALCELASRDVTVALSGQGADELLGGYRRHRLAAIAGSWHRLPAPLREVGTALVRRRSARFSAIAEALQATDPVARMIGSIGLLRPELRHELYSGALAEHADAAERHLGARLNGSSGAVPLEAAMYLEAQLGLVDDRLHYFDRASMAWSLEVRVPFLDHELVELCASFPPSAKATATEGKRALRRAARGLVPDFVLDKRKLGFFSTSVESWLESHSGSLVDELLLAAEPRYAQVLSPALVRRLVYDWRNGERRHSRAVLALVMLELWLREFLPRAFDAASRPIEPAVLVRSAP